MKSVKLIRLHSDQKQTLGVLTVVNLGRLTFVCNTLERGWLNNQPNVSCIPVGDYLCKWTRSPSFSLKAGKDVFTYEIMGVPGRAGIRIHSANYYSQLNGCIALGSAVKDLNMDTLMDIQHSGDTMIRFQELMAFEDFKLNIVNNL